MIKGKEMNIPFSIARVFAILSVAAAHVSINNSPIIDKIISVIGSVGVVVFIIMSGYFYRSEKFPTVLDMLKSKFKSIVIPWGIMGTLTYFIYKVLPKRAFYIKDWLLWLAGHQTYLYYLTVLMLCCLIFYKRNKVSMYLSIIITVLSLYLTAFGMLDGMIQILHITNYLNIFNWIGYFALGCILQETDSEKLYSFFLKGRYVFLAVFLILWSVICIFDIKTGYFSFIGLPYQLTGAMAVFGISTVKMLDKKPMHEISNMTFGIYLLHMPVISITGRLYNASYLTQIISPLIIIVISIVILKAGYLISNRIHLSKMYSAITGVRIERNFK